MTVGRLDCVGINMFMNVEHIPWGTMSDSPTHDEDRGSRREAAGREILPE